jgi:hypothetical protein
MTHSNQLLDVTVGFSYSFSATFVILLFLKYVSMIFRPAVKFGKQKVHEFLLERSPDYGRRHRSFLSRQGNGVGNKKGRDSHRTKAISDNSYRAKIIPDKLVALGQHIKQEEGLRNSHQV